jgi:hypothetical protein
MGDGRVRTVPGEFIVLLIEFGFNLSATRAIARNGTQEKSAAKSLPASWVRSCCWRSAVSAAIIVSRWISPLR